MSPASLSARLDALVRPRNEHRLLGLMLLTMHLGIWWEFGGAVSRSMMLAHLGLFLLWQPLWNRQRRLDRASTGVFVVATVAFVAWLDWGLLTFWLLLLAGFVGGRVNTGRGDRYAYLASLVFLLTELLIGCIPPIVRIEAISADTRPLFVYGMLVVPVGLMFVPRFEVTEDDAPSVDFLYALTVSLLSCVLATGSLLAMYLTGASYVVAVIETIVAIAAFLLAISWLWLPLAGFSGLGQIWERYVQNIGTPFERWLSGLARLSRTRSTPGELLVAAMEQLSDLPWVAGVSWQGSGLEGSLGLETPHRFLSRCGEVNVTVYAQRPLGTALLLHGKLLLRLVAQFYVAKEREQELTRQAHLQAIHETGARVTHDIKNLLQSLHTVSIALQGADPERRDEAQRMLERQLPHITKRLRLALDKLQAPQDDGPVARSSLRAWWHELEARNEGDGIAFRSTLTADRDVPVELFDSVVENLLENARAKRQSQPDIGITVSLDCSDERLSLAVEDTGTPVEPEVATALFEAPVRSRTGLGIGLFQAARQAAQHGYRLGLDGAAPDRVRFELTEMRGNAD